MAPSVSIQVNSQVIRPQEKSLMIRLVDIMASLELRFVQERAEGGQLSYRLDPYVIHNDNETISL